MQVIDRRINPKGKMLGSRQRFIERVKDQVKKAVGDAIGNTRIPDFNKGTVRVPIRGIGEPTFNPDPGTGRRKAVIPGNKDFVEGDRLPKPQQGSGAGGGEASDDGDGEDGFEFALTKEEFLEFFFDDLALPNLVKKEMKRMLTFSPKRAGYSTSGNPANMSIAQTVKRSIGRRIALSRPKQEEIDALQQELDATDDRVTRAALLGEIERLERRMRGIPYIDKSDLRFRNFTQQPNPMTSAVVFFLMDVSGSMQEREKDIAKRFFILLYLLLHKQYEKVEIVFVRHHHAAEECTEQDFFYKKESGGTVVSTGLSLINQIIEERFNPAQWNIYVAQASDGDNFKTDAANVQEQMALLLDRTQYYTYLDIPSEYLLSQPDSDLWEMLEKSAQGRDNMAMAKAHTRADIWKVFRELFKKETA